MIEFVGPVEKRFKQGLYHEGCLCRVNESRFCYQGSGDSLNNIKEENYVI